MKALDYFLIICALALLGIAFFFHTKGNYGLAASVNFCAFMCGVALSARIGGRVRKKNQENNK
ncbi:MAG: hypothetical protein IJ539_02695 [Prevotella sp.]|nr:hypothetical protein [Prevotella sp.]